MKNLENYGVHQINHINLSTINGGNLLCEEIGFLVNVALPQLKKDIGEFIDEQVETISEMF
ncbi:hypothetical protein M0D21_21920 [Aquimarina sp. D1M17]|uniref:hypothetical protein n=1 Tax=Aquimarina acroporae TaxID=2937283 RepID=UPI0020C0FA01|nr:hypothetical protein [Aquimarina acroporae]MCK8524252.1 hypothetical protein [Aquimarina acroporae]